MFHKLTVEDGLSQNAVLCFTQDKQGYMWIGTSSGLNRYNSRNFQIFKHNSDEKSSLSGNNVFSLLTDHKDRVWVGTTNGLNRYNKKTGVFDHFLLESPIKNVIVNNLIRSLYEDSKQQLWVGTQKGFYLFHESPKPYFEEIVFQHQGRNLLSTDIRAIKEDEAGDLWIAIGDQVLRLSKHFNERVMHVYPIVSPRHSTEDKTCTSIEYANGNIWIGTIGAGVFRFNEPSQQFEEVINASHPITPLPHDYVRKLLANKEGNTLWIGTQQGLCEYDLRSNKLITYQHEPSNRYSLSQNSIYDIYLDRAGNLWAGTYYGGISTSYAHNTPFQIEQATGKKDGLLSNVVSSVYGEQGKGLWTGTDAGGLSFKDTRSGLYQHYRYSINDQHSIGSNLVKCIYKDQEGNIWIGTHGGGLNLLNADRKGFTRFKRTENSSTSLSSNDVLNIAEDREGFLWLAMENNGLNRFDKKTNTVTRYHQDSSGLHHFGSSFPKMVLIDKLDNVWISTENGLFLKKKESPYIKEYDHIFKNGLSIPKGEATRSIYEDAHRDLWIGTANKGIFLIRPAQDLVEHFTTENGLPSNNIKGLCEDLEGNLWITTDNGLCKFERKHKTFIAFNIYDGLPGNDFNSNSFFRDQEGRIFVGSLNGLIHFDPASIEKNNAIQNIIFHSLRIGNELITPEKRPDILASEINQQKEIQLRHNDNVFTIDFSLLNFIKPNKNQYLYRLAGFENDWISNNTGSATYSNLPSGTYTLEVKAANNDGVWNPDISRLKIVVHPPFWATWWAYLCYIAIISFIIYFIVRSFWLKEKYKQEQQFQQYKIDFFTNISHEIRTQLTLISTPLDAMAQNELPEHMRKGQLEMMQKHTRRLTDLVSELLDFRKAETGNMPLKKEETCFWPMLTEIAEGFKPIAHEKGIEVQLTSKDEALMVQIDRQQMSKVISNLINNGLKFTERGGKVGIELKAKGELAIVRIWDTGIGIDPKYFRNLFTNFFQVNDNRQLNTGYGIGLALAKRIVELHGGIIDVSSKVKMQGHAGFTVFTVKLPISKPNMLPDRANDPIAKEQHPVTREKPLLLVVEDHEDLRRFIADALSTDYELMEAEHGEEGVNMALEYIPDLIISDIMMPVMDGLTLCTTLKKDKQTSHIPIILLTAKTTIDDQIKGLENNADAYLTKPFDLKLLRTQVHNLLQNRAQLQEAYRSHYLSPLDKTMEASLAPDPFLQKMVEIIHEHIEDSDFTITELTRKLAVSHPVLYKKVKALTGLSVNDFIKSLRMKKAVELLQSKQYNIAEVAYLVGFSDRKYFSKEFKKYHGVTPSEFAINHS